MPSPPFDVKRLISNDKEMKNLVTTTVVGQNGTQKVLRYDMHALVKFSALLTCVTKGTVFTMDRTALINVFIMLLIGFGVCCLTLLFSVNNIEQLQKLDTKPLEALAKQINSFVPFCLALYISLTLKRWWTLRKDALGKVFDAFTNICMIISSELSDKKWHEARMQVAKYGFASIELLIQAAREKPDQERVVKSELLTQVEIDALFKSPICWQRPMILWAWIMRICTSAMDHQRSPAPRTGAVVAACISAREGMHTMNTYLDTQLPFAYVHLITLLVNIQNLMVSIKSGIFFAKAATEADGFVMVQQVLTLLLVCFIYQALLQISYTIMDPFGDDVLDFPMQAYQSYVAATIDAMLEAQPECPVVAEDGTLHRPKPRKVRSTSRNDLLADSTVLRVDDAGQA